MKTNYYSLNCDACVSYTDISKFIIGTLGFTYTYTWDSWSGLHLVKVTCINI